MKKKVVFLALALIVVSVAAFWGLKAAFFPGTTAQAIARDFLIRCYSIPDHERYAQKRSSDVAQRTALQKEYQALVTEDYLKTFLTERGSNMLEDWAGTQDYLVAIDQIDVQPSPAPGQDATNDLRYDITLILTRESDMRLATCQQSGRVQVQKTKDGYRVSAWTIDNESEFYRSDFFADK